MAAHATDCESRVKTLHPLSSITPRVTSSGDLCRRIACFCDVCSRELVGCLGAATRLSARVSQCLPRRCDYWICEAVLGKRNKQCWSSASIVRSGVRTGLDVLEEDVMTRDKTADQCMVMVGDSIGLVVCIYRQRP